MRSTPKTVGIPMASLLVLGLSSAVQAGTMPWAAEEKAGRSERTTDGQMPNSQIIQGNVKQVKGNNYVIKGLDGTEIKLHTDNTTVMSDHIFPGDRIEAKITEKNHALSMLQSSESSPKAPDEVRPWLASRTGGSSMYSYLSDLGRRVGQRSRGSQSVDGELLYF